MNIPFLLTNIIIVLNIFVNIRWLRYFLIYIMIGGNYIFYIKKEKIINKIINIFNSTKYNLLIYTIVNISTHIILPIILLQSVKGKIEYDDWLNGIICIVLYGSIINIKNYYYISKYRFIMSSIIIWSIIYLFLKTYF